MFASFVVLRFGFDCLKTIELFGSLLFPLFLGMYICVILLCAHVFNFIFYINVAHICKSTFTLFHLARLAKLMRNLHGFAFFHARHQTSAQQYTTWTGCLHSAKHERLITIYGQRPIKLQRKMPCYTQSGISWSIHARKPLTTITAQNKELLKISPVSAIKKTVWANSTPDKIVKLVFICWAC